MRIGRFFNRALYKMEQGLAFLRWFIVGIASLFLWITAKFLSPILWFFKEFITASKFPILYYYFDHEEGYFGNDNYDADLRRKWKIFKPLYNTKFWKFWVYYMWNGWRNPAWRGQTKLVPRNKKAVQRLVDWFGRIFSYKKRVNIEVNHDVSLHSVCGAKQCDFDGTYNGFGEFISPYLSNYGKLFIWFRINKTLHFRFSMFKRTKIGWIEIQIGVSENKWSPSRYIYKLKRKTQAFNWYHKDLPIEE